MKLAVNKLGFPLVTHTVDSDARFDSYLVLKSRHDAESFLDRLDKRMNNPILRAENV
jgi:hypothetical protein